MSPTSDLPASIWLRHHTGESLGPISLRAIEVLFDSRVIDEGTPVSENGAAYRALSDWPELHQRVTRIKEQLARGENPWAQPEPRPASRVVATSAPSPAAAPYTSDHPLQAMLKAALDRHTGPLFLMSTGGGGELKILYKEGKVVALETSEESLSLRAHLVREGLVNEAAILKAEGKAPEVGGDLGAALIALGSIPPHTYFERFVEWAKRTLGAAVSGAYGTALLEPGEVGAAAVPLSFDRFGVLMESVREGLDRARLEERVLVKRACPLILSQVEGAKIEDMKLKASELRVMNAINGVKSLGDIIDSLGGNDQKSLEILRLVFFASETGFVVFGTDPLLQKEVQESVKVREALERMKKKHYFEILGITEKNSDDDVRTRYADLAKQYHPDKLRPGAAQELVDVRKELFALVNEAFEALQTEDRRYRYANDIAQGRTGNQEELEKVQNTLQAETLFKKAEILARVKKYDDALQHLDDAIRLKGDDAEFKIYRAYYGYLQAARQGPAPDVAEKAIRSILTLMKTDGNIASGYLFLAYLNKAVGKAELALKYFDKVLEYDEKNAEAMREVRLANMRNERTKKKKWF